ncbi:MAG: hypothetical protein AB1696_24600 [Planctomycetota bacterium]
MKTARPVILCLVTIALATPTWVAAQPIAPLYPEAPTPDESEVIAALTDKRIDLPMQKAPLLDAISAISHQLGITVIPVGNTDEKRDVLLDVTDVSGLVAMLLVLEPDENLAVIGNCIVIGPAGVVETLFRKKPVVPEGPTTPPDNTIYALDNKRTTITFQDADRQTAIDLIAHLAEWKVIYDKNARTYGTVNMRLRNVTLRTALRILCGPELNYGIQNGTIYVSSDEGLKKMMLRGE